ncbi:MAG: sodium:solute symporter family protein [Pirellulales bacterium]|nr:sodium:solute symporter family protein [Pirellulales bacterium]
MTLFGLPIVDWLVIVAYLAAITVIGTWAVRKVKSSASFFISDRSSRKLLMIFFNFGTGTHSDQAVSVARQTYRNGASGIWVQLLWIFSTPLYWLIAPLFRRMRAVTTSDYFEARYDKSTAVLYALVAMLNLIVNIGAMLIGSGKTIEAISGGAIDSTVAIVLMTMMFVVYGVAGGLNAAILTDLIQGLLTIVLSFLILPFALYSVGGMTEMRATIDQVATAEYQAEIAASADTDHPGRTPEGREIQKKNMFSLVSVEIGLFYIVVISLNGLIGYGTQPHTMSLCAAGRTEMDARVGMTCGMFIKRFCTVAWVLTGLCAVAIYVDQRGSTDFDIDHVYGLMARDLLPTIGPGLVGLFIASMLAAVMSSCDAFMVACSALFTENIYRKLIVPNADDRHYMWVGRTVSVLVVVCAISYAFMLEDVMQALEVFWKISAMMGLAFWVGLFWRRATPAGAWAGTLVSFALLLFTSRLGPPEHAIWDFNAQLAHRLPDFMLWKGELYLPWQMIFYLVPGFVTIVMVSLLTPRLPRRRLDRFYECLRTPVGPGEPETEPFTLPPGVKPAERRVWLDFLELEMPRISRVGLAGLVGASAAVALFIAAVYWIFSLGA